MRFYVRKRHSTPAVIIVALIDVLIVLVIFLLVTTTFKQQSALRLQLPASAQAKKMGANENRTVVVSVNAKGMYFMDDLPVTSEQMQMKLKMAALQNPNVVVAINADTGAPWGKIVQVRDAAGAAKIKTLVAYTKEKQKP